MFECMIVQGSVLNVSEIAIYADESERRALDFNLRIISQYMTLLNKISVGGATRFVIGGANRFYNVVLALVEKVAPQEKFLSNLEMIDCDQVEDLVVDPNEIPVSWFDDGEGKPYISTDRRNVWSYERCLSDDNRFTLKDIYNPEPWVFEEVDYEALRLEKAATGGPALEAIAEDGDQKW